MERIPRGRRERERKRPGLEKGENMQQDAAPHNHLAQVPHGLTSRKSWRDRPERAVQRGLRGRAYRVGCVEAQFLSRALPLIREATCLSATTRPSARPWDARPSSESPNSQRSAWNQGPPLGPLKRRQTFQRVE